MFPSHKSDRTGGDLAALSNLLNCGRHPATGLSRNLSAGLFRFAEPEIATRFTQVGLLLCFSLDKLLPRQRACPVSRTVVAWISAAPPSLRRRADIRCLSRGSVLRRCCCNSPDRSWRCHLLPLFPKLLRCCWCWRPHTCLVGPAKHMPASQRRTEASESLRQAGLVVCGRLGSVLAGALSSTPFPAPWIALRTTVR